MNGAKTIVFVAAIAIAALTLVPGVGNAATHDGHERSSASEVLRQAKRDSIAPIPAKVEPAPSQDRKPNGRDDISRPAPDTDPEAPMVRDRPTLAPKYSAADAGRTDAPILRKGRE